MKAINISKGLFTQVDDRDYDDVIRWTWVAANSKSKNSTHQKDKCYAVTWDKINKTGKKIRLATMIWEKYNGPVPVGLIVDHHNGDPLDNRLENLRLSTRGQNNCNKSKTTKPCSSIYKGVCWLKNICKWQAQISFQKKSYLIGYYDDEKIAALAYNEKARELHGEHARLNSIS